MWIKIPFSDNRTRSAFCCVILPFYHIMVVIASIAANATILCIVRRRHLISIKCGSSMRENAHATLLIRREIQTQRFCVICHNTFQRINEIIRFIYLTGSVFLNPIFQPHVTQHGWSYPICTADEFEMAQRREFDQPTRKGFFYLLSPIWKLKLAGYLHLELCLP